MFKKIMDLWNTLSKSAKIITVMFVIVIVMCVWGQIF